jgi:hypothetical protein
MYESLRPSHALVTGPPEVVGPVGRETDAALTRSTTHEATTNEYTLERVDGTWKITKLVRNLNGSA